MLWGERPVRVAVTGVAPLSPGEMRTITISGGNCYQLAAQYLNDATQFIRIMIENDLTDPMLPNTAMTLVIPDIDATQTGGVPPQ